MKAKAFATFLCGLTFLLGTATHATVIGLGDFSGSETLIDFTGISVPATPAPINLGGVSVDSSVSDLVIYPDIYGVWAETPLASGGDHLSNQIVESTSIEFLFDNPVNRVGMWINGGNTATHWTFSAFDINNNLVGSHVFNFTLVDGYPDPSIFGGVEFAQAFTRLSIVETIHNRQYTSIDDLRFESTSEIPEPATILLFGVGLLGITSVGRRKK